MNFRPAQNKDREAIEALIFPILQSHGLAPSPEHSDADLKDLESSYFRNRGHFEVLVDEEDRIHGTVAIHQTSPALCELRKMYLADTLRGQGWGKRLLQRALEIAKDLGYSEIWLETAYSLTKARELYQQNGFKPFSGPHCSERCDFALKRKL